MSPFKSGGWMKQRNKAVIAIGLSSFFFLAIAYTDFISASYLNLAVLTVFYALILVSAWYVIGIKRLEKLNYEVMKLNQQNDEKTFTERVTTDGKDEISSIAHQINLLQSNLQIFQDNLDQKINEKTQELQEKNSFLQHEIDQQVNLQKKLINDRECLTRIARYDDLTALPNRIFFNEILNKSISHAKRYNKSLAVLLIDIDQFKKINHMLGTVKSDYVLKEIGKRFTNVLRSEDILAKLDGDEYIVLLNDIKHPKFSSTVAEKLLNVCSHLMKVDDHEFTLTASIGICIYPNDGESLEDLLKNTDEALYKAKHSGGNAYHFYTRAMDVEAKEYIQLESALRKAIHNNELALYYQPKLNIRKGKIVGLETFMRWEHPVLGIISPTKFIPLAEETGLIMEIGEWALRKACRSNKYWQDEGYEHVTVSVNLSPKQFHHPEISKIVSKVLKSTGLNPRYLELEISENTVMGNIELAEKILNDLKQTGVQISIDHFGMGYTSINHLKQFPINVIKIDRNFIKGVPNNPNDSAITSAMIALAHNLGLEVIAEGVETAEQVQHLSSYHCDMIQGYFLSHPVTAQKIILQLRKLSEAVLL